MPDLTESVIIATFCTALGIFALTATTRKLLGKSSLSATSLKQALANEEVPHTAPMIGRVPTGLYRPLDLLGLGLLFVAFFGLTISSIRTAEAKSELVLTVDKLVSSIGFQFVMAGIVTALVVRRVGLVQWLGLRWPGWRWVFVIAPAGVISMHAFFIGVQALGFMRWIRSLGVETVQDTVKIFQNSTDPQLVGLMVVAAVIAAPLCEEIVFRGYLYPVAKRFAGPWVAGICSALVFSAVHGSLAALLPLFVVGCMLVFVYEKTGSLWAPIAVHFCFNGVTVVMQLAARYYKIDLGIP